MRLQQGRLAEVEEWWRVAAERTQSPMMKALDAQWLAELGQMAAAAESFDGLAETGFAHPTHNAAWLVFVTECAWLCARLDRVDCVPRLRSALEPYADQLVLGAFAAWVGGPVSYFLGLLATTVGEWAEAEARFAAAAATQQRVGARGWLARTRLEWARMLLARSEPGDEGRARELLSQALAAASEIGLAAIERDAADLRFSS
jgi:hypothetical protein